KADIDSKGAARPRRRRDANGERVDIRANGSKAKLSVALLDERRLLEKGGGVRLQPDVDSRCPKREVLLIRSSPVEGGCAMAQLIVVAEATSGGEESPGTSSKFEGPIIAVSVTKTDGTPVTGLAYKNFTLHFLRGGSSVELNSFVPLSIMDI